MSQLIDDFRRAVDAFNACQNAADYQSLSGYYDPSARISEVDPPHTAHTPSGAVINYLKTTQPQLLPRFWPDYRQIIERPANSDNATHASLEGPATYVDCTTSNAAGNRTPIVVNYHFEFSRPDTRSPWLVTVGWAR
jgi:hypothetical protein